MSVYQQQVHDGEACDLDPIPLGSTESFYEDVMLLNSPEHVAREENEQDLRDIMPFKSPLGGHTHIEYGPMNASETFDVGEPVQLNTDGEIAGSGATYAGLEGAVVPLFATNHTNLKTGTNQSNELNPAVGLDMPSAKDADTFDMKFYGVYRASAQWSDWRGNWGSAF